MNVIKKAKMKKVFWISGGVLLVVLGIVFYPRVKGLFIKVKGLFDFFKSDSDSVSDLDS